MLLSSEFNLLLPLKVKNLLRLGRDYDGGYLVCEKTLKKCRNLIILLQFIIRVFFFKM